MNKRFLGSVTAVVSAAALSLTLVAPAANAAAPTNAKKDKSYVSWVRSNSDDFDYTSRKQLVRTAKAACRALRSGATGYELIEASLDSGISDDGIAALLSGAVVYYCPNMSYKFE
jgi:hypothetical protein